MPGLDAGELVVAGSGHIWDAPVGTTFPASISEAVDEGDWTDLGYTTEEGVHFTFDRTSKDILPWQSREAVRTIILTEPKNYAFTMMQWNPSTHALAIGGGTWTEFAAGEFEFEPPAAGATYDRAQIVEFTDGEKNYRFCFRNVINKAPYDFSTLPTDTANMPVNMSVQADPDGAYFAQTDDPAFAPVGS